MEEGKKEVEWGVRYDVHVNADEMKARGEERRGGRMKMKRTKNM